MRFEKLEVWQLAYQLSCSLYVETKALRDFGVKDQITRSGLLVPSNIADKNSSYARRVDKKHQSS